MANPYSNPATSDAPDSAPPALGGGTSSSGGVGMANKSAATQRTYGASHGRVLANFNITVAAIGTLVSPPSYRVPDGGVVEVRPRSNNTGAIYVAPNGQARARISANTPAPGAHILQKSDVPAIFSCQNLSELSFDADTNADGASILVKWGG